MKKFLKNTLLLIVLVSFCLATKDTDRIFNLPGLSKQPLFKQYSGYLQGKYTNNQLHYWFVESQNKPLEDPLVLWLNGGPGCSSLEGLLAENGPFRIQKDNKLTENPESWNKLANVLYLESPAGVGFSYAKDRNITTNDDIVSENNYHALLSFMEIFPEYLNRDFYITGESYGGIYVPTLANRVINGGKLKLKGIAVGNGMTNYNKNDNSLIYFGAYHGLIGDKSWKYLLKNCCANDPTKQRCDFQKKHSYSCDLIVQNFMKELDSGLNRYNLYAPCAGGIPSQKKGNNTGFDFQNLFRSNRLIAEERKNSVIPTNMEIPCVDTSLLVSYLNLHEVRQALHIPSEVERWEACSIQVIYNYGRIYKDLKDQYLAVLKGNVKVFIYNGDVDMACNFLGDQWFVDDLGLIVKENRRPWLFVAEDGTTQIAGFTKSFYSNKDKDNTLTYLTVRGAGHMVPQDKPLPAFKLFKCFLDGTDL